MDEDKTNKKKKSDADEKQHVDPLMKGKSGSMRFHRWPSLVLSLEEGVVGGGGKHIADRKKKARKKKKTKRGGWEVICFATANMQLWKLIRA